MLRNASTRSLMLITSTTAKYVGITYFDKSRHVIRSDARPAKQIMPFCVARLLELFFA